MDRKVLLTGPYSEVDQQALRSTENHASRWPHSLSITVVLLLSLGLWAAIWWAVASLASAVIR